MEAQWPVLSPLKIEVCLDGPGPSHGKVRLNVYPATTVRHLIVYTHHYIQDYIQAQFGENIGNAREYSLLWDSRILKPNSRLADVLPSKRGIIKLGLAKYGCDNRIPLNVHAFNHVNIQIKMVDAKTLQEVAVVNMTHVHLHKTLKDVTKYALSQLSEEKFTMPSSGPITTRTTYFFENLQILGIKNPMDLTANTDLISSMTLSNLLSMDMAPFTNENDKHYFVLKFQVRYKEVELEAGETYQIELESNSNLLVTEMRVFKDTTLTQVKDFICGVYANALRVYHQDIKLIYCDELITQADSTKLMDIIDVTTSNRLFVKITQEYREPGPGFWNELFNSPNRFNFMYNTPTPTSMLKREDQEVPLQITTQPNKNNQVHRLGELWEMCGTTNGHQHVLTRLDTLNDKTECQITGLLPGTDCSLPLEKCQITKTGVKIRRDAIHQLEAVIGHKIVR